MSIDTVTFLPFKKRLNMSSLIANQDQICILVSLTLFVRTNLCATVQTYTTYTTIITTITIFSLFLSAYNFFGSHTSSLFFSYDHSLFYSQLFCKQYSYSLDLHSSDLQTCKLIQQDQSNERS